MEEKACSTCGEVKPLTAFGNAGRRFRRAMCRVCYNARRKKHYHQNRDEKIRIRMEYQNRPEIRARRKEKRNSPEVKAKEKIAAKRYRSNPVALMKISVTRKAYEANPVNRARMIRHSALTRATKLGLPFNLSEQWVVDRVVKGHCEVSGIPFDCQFNGRTRRNPFCPSIDQIDAGKGYTEDNCRVVLVAVNLALCDWGLPQFLHIAKRVLEHNGFVVMDGQVRKVA